MKELPHRCKIVTIGQVPVFVSFQLVLVVAVINVAWPGWEGVGITTGVLCIEVIHELGHAFMIRRLGVRLHEIEISMIGGHCRYDDDTTTKQDAIIAWGGPITAMVIVTLTLVVWLTGMWPDTPFFEGLFGVLLVLGCADAAYNLLPFEGFDGYYAWRILER